MRQCFFLFVCCICIAASADAQERTARYGAVEGTAATVSGEPLAGVNIMLKESRSGCVADPDGKFLLENIRPGTYTIEASCVGYKPQAKKLVVVAGRRQHLAFILESTIYYIGGIEVVADHDLMPKDPETKNEIRSGQIEHLQASSLRDVLQLIPGVKTTNPDLGGVQQANIRGSDRDVSGKNVGSFGTQVMVDNVPVSNNANMQLDGGTSSTAARGVDLRGIPSENIESVEVIRGIPSARYGDMTSGIVKVTTKVGRTPTRLKMKYNPNTYEGNFSGGTDAFGTGIGYNINVASSARDIRKPGDGYTRVALQLSTVNSFLDENALTLKNIVSATRAYDEVKEEPSYALRQASYDRDVNVRYTLDAQYQADKQTSVKAVVSASYTRQNSFKQEMVSRDNLVLSDLKQEGVTSGRFVFGSYLSQYYVKGNMWTVFANTEATKKFFLGDLFHTVSAGATAQYDVNRGEGRVYDPFFPPSASANVGDRPRSYDELPGITTVSLFAEEKMSGNIIVPFTLQAGLRYQMFNPNAVRFSGLFGSGDFVSSDQGTFLDPRVTFSATILPETQLRLGYGQTSKAPPLATIYPNFRYYDVADTVAVNPADLSKNFSILSTYIFDRSNRDLKGYTQRKYEASIDQQIGDCGVSLTGFYNQTRGGFASATVPVRVLKKSWPKWPDPTVYSVKDTLLDKIYVSRNAIATDAKGVELTFKTRRLPVINTIFEFDGSYNYYTTKEEGGLVYGGLRTDPKLGTALFPIHNAELRFSEDVLLKYRFDVLLEELRIWVTLLVEQQVMERDGYQGTDDSLAVGYYSRTSGTVMIPEAERANALYSNLRSTPQRYELLTEDRPNKWLFNLKVSKELWPGAEVSFFVNNFLNDRPLYRLLRTDPNTVSYERRNPTLFFGLEFSTVFTAAPGKARQ